MRKFWRLPALAGIGPVCALAGGIVDERTHLGFTNWRSACRSAGFSIQSVTNFTLELLPTAVVGALLGGLLVQAHAFRSRHSRGHVGHCLAAHAGCALAMPLGLMLCALAFPIPLMLAAEVLLAVAAASVIRTLAARSTHVRLHP